MDLGFNNWVCSLVSFGYKIYFVLFKVVVVFVLVVKIVIIWFFFFVVEELKRKRFFVIWFIIYKIYNREYIRLNGKFMLSFYLIFKIYIYIKKLFLFDRNNWR